jgi:queuine tRNA-ribosyltransferase
MTLRFERLHQDGRARRGRITMPRGTIETPVFMPVGTAATVKGMFPRDLAELGTTISLANTYHLHIQPGEALVEKAGGLHTFMAMPWPILTDSGGFQVFSLPRKEITEQGVEFEFQKGATPIFASPEWSMKVQNSLGADIIMAFDECAPWPCTEDHAERAMQRTLRWLDRCVEAHARDDQYLFGIVQGSVYGRLRRTSAEETMRRDLPGYSIGGVSVGEGHTLMMKAVDDAEPHMDAQKPRYLMGVGLPEDIVGAVGRGIDMFDCVIPTRYGRSGTVFTRRGRIRITDRAMRNDHYPIDPSCSCYACSNFSRAYIHHLIRTDEILGTMLCTLHNVAFYHGLMERIRSAIEQGAWAEFVDAFDREYLQGDRARRREPWEPGLFSSFEVGFAHDRARDEHTVQREQQEARRSPSGYEEAPKVEADAAPSRARASGDKRVSPPRETPPRDRAPNSPRAASSHTPRSKETGRDRAGKRRR